MDKNYQGARIFLASLICSLGLLTLLFWTYLSAIVLALLIASVFYPIYLSALRIFRQRRQPAAISMCIIILLIVILPAGWFVGTVSNEAYDFYKRTSSAVSVNKIQEFLNSDSVWADRINTASQRAGVKLDPKSLEKFIKAIGKYVGLFLYKQLSSVASNLLSFLIHFFLMMLTIYYVLKDGGRLKNYIIDLIPLPVGQMEKVANKFHEMGWAILVGNGLSGITQGILGGFGFFLFGIKAPFLWGSVLAFMAFLPVIGASVVFVPATLFLFFQGKISVAMGFLIYNMVYSSIIEYFLKPRLIGQGMHMNSLMVFIGIIGGIKLFGIMGIIYGPLIITIFITLAEIYRTEYRESPTAGA